MTLEDATFNRRLRWRLEWLAYLGFEQVAGLLPAAFAARLGAGLGWCAAKLSTSRRRVVERNLRIAFGREKTPAELAALTAEVFKRSGANLISSLCTARMTEAQLARVVRIENPEMRGVLDAQGKGVVVVLAHMGNWEVLAQAFTKLIPPGSRAGTIYRLLNNPYLDQHVKNVRRRSGLELFEKRSNPLAMAAFLRHGGSLGILSDQRAESAGEIVSYFGRLTSCTPLPAILARRLGVPVVGISMRTEAPGRWVMKLHSLDGPPTTQACMHLLESMIRESPADVFWLQDRWRTHRKSPFELNGRAPTIDALSARTQARRILLWLGDDDFPAQPASNAEDLAWECSVPVSRDHPLPSWLLPGVCVHRRVSALTDRDATQQELNRIDQSQPAPLEVVVFAAGQRTLLKACRRLGLATVETASQTT